MRPVNTQISLGICPVWSESSLYAQWVAKDRSFLYADSKDSDQTGRMPRLIWVFAGWTCHFVGFIMRWLINVHAQTLSRARDVALSDASSTTVHSRYLKIQGTKKNTLSTMFALNWIK